MSHTGGNLITDILGAYGIDTVFSVAGASHTYLLDPLDQAGVTILSSRHESGAVGAADGYARVKGAPGVALIVADQGLPNAIGGLAVAWHAASPVVVLVAAPARPLTEADRGLDTEQLQLVSPVTKWARTVPSAERLAEYLHTALKHATQGRPGPVVLLVPEDQLQASTAPDGATAWAPGAKPLADPQAIAAAAEMISAAERPLIIAGGGTAWSDASEPLREFATAFGVPVLGNSLGRGQVPEDNDVSFSWPYAQIAANQADVVVVVGARLTQRLGLGLPPRFSASAKFIQIDIDAGAFHRNRPVDLAIQADATHALKALLVALHDRRAPHFSRAWLHTALHPRAERIAEIVSGNADALHPLQLGHELMARLPEDAQLIGDGADIQSWMYGVVRVRRPRGFLDHYPMGAMGSGTALAVGAAAAHRELSGAAAPVTILITGDGAFGFHPAEIHAAVRAQLNLKIIIGNDGAWGTELHGQREAIGRTINTELGVLPYEKLGEAFGAAGFAIEAPEEVASVLDRAMSQPGVSVVNVVVDRDAGRELKTNPLVRMIMFSDILDGQSELP